MTQRSDPAQSNEMSDQKDQISKKFDNNEPALDQSDGLRTERAYISRSTTKSAMSEDDQLKVSSSSSIRDVEVIRDKLTEENDNNDCRLQVKSLKVEGISTSVVADTADRELQMKHSIMTKKDQTMNHNKNNKGNTCNSEMISKYVDSKRTIVPEEAIYKNKSYNNASRGGFRMHANCVIETNANSCSETRIGPPRPSVAAEPTIANDSRLKACHFPSMRPDATNTSSSIKSFTPRFISTPGFVSKTDGRTIMVPNSGISLTSDISSNSYPQEDSIDTNIRFAQYRLRKLHNAGQNDSRYSDRVMELKGRAKSKPEAEVGFPRLTIDKADLSAIPSSYSCAEFKFPIQTNNAGRFFCHLCNHGISNVIDFKRHLTEVHKVDPMIAENFIPTNLSRLCRENLRYFPHSYNQQLNSRFESQSVMKNKRKILEASHRRNAIRGDSVGKAGENEETFSLNDACYSTEPHDKFVSNKDARRTRDMRIRITSPCHRSFMRTSPWSETKNGFRLNLIDKNYHKTSRNSTSTSIKPNDSSPESSNGASQGNYTISDNKMQNTIQDAKLDSQRNNLLGPHSRLQQTASSNDRNNCSAGFASTLNSHKNELRHLNELDRRVLEDYYAFRPIPLAKDIIILSCELRLSKDLISLWFAERHKLTNRENHRRGSFISGSYRPFFEQPKYFRHPLRHHNCPICYAIFPTYIHLVRHMHSCRESQYLSHDCGTRSVKDHYIIAGWHGRHFLRHNEDQKPADPIRFSNSDRLLSNHKYVPNAKSTIESGKYCEAEPAKENLTNYHCFADNIRSENGKNGTSRAVSHSLTEKSMDGKWEDNEADRIEELIAREDSSDKIQDDDQNSSKTEPKEPHIGEDCDSQVKSRSFDREMRNGDHQQFVSEIDGKSEEESWAKYAADSNLDDGDFSTQTQISTFEQNHDFSSEDCENKNIPNKRKMTRSSRTRFSDLQIKVLYDYFRFRQYPTDSEIGFLSRELRLDRRVITVWFQNSRQKLKAQIRKFNKSGGEATNASRAVKSISARMMNGKTSHLSDIIYSERTAMDVSTSPNSDQLYFKNTTHSCFYCHAVYPTYIHLVHHIRFCKYCPTAQGFSHSSYSEKSAGNDHINPQITKEMCRDRTKRLVGVSPRTFERTDDDEWGINHLMTTKYRIGSNTDSPEPNSAPNDSSLEQPAKLNKLDDFDSKRIFNDAVGSVDCNYYDEVDETYSSQSHNDELTLRIVENPECSDLKGHNEQRIMDVAIDSYRKGCVSSISNSYASSHGSDSNISQPNESNDGENDISSKTHNEDDCTRHGSSENIGTEPKVNLINFSKIFSLSSVDENEKNQDSLNTSSITCESLDDKFRNNKPRIYLSNRNMQQKTKSQSRMKRRKRTKISDSQHSDLENLFALVNRPDSFQVNSIAMQCGLTPRVVQVWFQNRRAKHKRIESKRSELSAENKLSDFSNNSIITIGSPGETNDNTTMMDNHPSVRDLKTFEKFMTGEVKADQ